MENKTKHIENEKMKQKNLQHIEEMLQMLPSEEIAFIKGFISRYYFG